MEKKTNLSIIVETNRGESLYGFIGSITCYSSQVVNQALAGDGIGWFKINRMKDLMKDESYRDLVVTKLNKGLNRKISPDDHIDDVVSAIYKKETQINRTNDYGTIIEKAKAKLK